MSTEPDEISDDPAFTDRDQEDIVSQLTEDDIRERSRALSDAQEFFEELAYLANPKMPCPECSGAGSVSGGSLGDICVRCMGTRVIEQPGSRRMEMPPFAQLRAAIGAYGDALADLALPAMHKGKRMLALPAASTVPTLESILELQAQGTAKARQLAGGTPGVVDERLLKAPRRADEDGHMGNDYEDAELDTIEGRADPASTVDIEDGSES